MPQIEVKGLAKTTPDGGELLTAVSFRLEVGESLSIVGRSGSGKSTLLSLLGLLERFETGSYRIGDTDFRDISEAKRSDFRANHLGFVFQNSNLIPYLSVQQNVEVALSYSPLTGRDKRQRIAEVLDSLSISHLARRQPVKLSGGEKQRAAIARALVGRPSLLLADEPTGALDVETGEQIMTELLDTAAHGAAVVLVTHDMDHAAKTDHSMKLIDGELIPLGGNDA